MRTYKQEQEVVDLTNGHSQKEIAERTGLSKSVVIKVQRKYHLVLSFGRTVSSSRFRYKWDRDVWEKIIVRLYYEERRSLKEVAKICNISDYTLFRRMNELDLPRRNYKEAYQVSRRIAPYRTPPRCRTCGRFLRKGTCVVNHEEAP